MPAPFVTYATLNPERPLDPEVHPGNLPLVKNLHVEFQSPVTFFVGENGSGKSTLLEAMAVVAGLPIAGGGMAEVQAGHGIREESALASSLRLGFVHQPKDRYFFRAETQAHFASLLDERHDDPHFLNDRRAPADPYARYGKRPLHQMSHGEAFLSVMQNRFGDGLYFMDEPESALSPQRQLTLLALMHRLVTMGRSQFFVATHSAILLTFPEADVLSFDKGKPCPIAADETSHFRITRDLLNHPEAYWRHLRDDMASDGRPKVEDPTNNGELHL